MPSTTNWLASAKPANAPVSGAVNPIFSVPSPPPPPNVAALAALSVGTVVLTTTVSLGSGTALGARGGVTSPPTGGAVAPARGPTLASLAPPLSSPHAASRAAADAPSAMISRRL
jgi:hypothetical protein